MFYAIDLIKTAPSCVYSVGTHIALLLKEIDAKTIDIKPVALFCNLA